MLFHVAVDCKTSEWSPWTECSVDCGMGTMIRSRDILVSILEEKKPYAVVFGNELHKWVANYCYH